MSKQNYILIVLGLIILILGALGMLFYFQNKKHISETGQTLPIRQFLPFGNPANTTPANPTDINPEEGDNTTNNSTNTGTELPPRIRMLVQGPVAGATIISGERHVETVIPENTDSVPLTADLTAPNPDAENAPAALYVEKENGHIGQIFLDETETKQITSTTIPAIQEALFIGPSKVFFRYLASDNETIQTYGLNIPKIDADFKPLAIRGSFLTQNILSLLASPDKKTAFAFSAGQSGSVGVTVNDVGTKNQVFSSPLSELLPQWINTDTIMFNTKPNSTVAGYLFSYSLKTKVFKKVIGNIAGLTTLTSPDGKQVLYAAASDRTTVTGVYHTDTSTYSDFPFATLPDKCTWSKDSIHIYCAVPDYLPQGSYPEYWYQGRFHFNDSFWVVNANNGVGSQVAELNEAKAILDAVSLNLDPDEKYLVFINDQDNSLWEINLQ